MFSIPFFQHFQADPAFNMAFDETLIWLATENPGSVFLRAYSWLPGGITIGYNQKQESALDWSQVGKTPVVRRITGGRALYHDSSELTYAIAINLSCNGDGDNGKNSDIAVKVAEGLVSFVNRTGISAQFLRATKRLSGVSDDLHKAPCFASQARYEIVSEQAKVVASASRITSQVFFQHGAIKLHGVASHPALRLPMEIEREDSLEAIDKEDFALLSRLFCDTMSEQFGSKRSEDASLSSDSEKFLAHRLGQIREDLLGKRSPD